MQQTEAYKPHYDTWLLFMKNAEIEKLTEGNDRKDYNTRHFMLPYTAYKEAKGRIWQTFQRPKRIVWTALSTCPDGFWHVSRPPKGLFSTNVIAHLHACLRNYLAITHIRLHIDLACICGLMPLKSQQGRSTTPTRIRMTATTAFPLTHCQQAASRETPTKTTPACLWTGLSVNMPGIDIYPENNIIKSLYGRYATAQSVILPARIRFSSQSPVPRAKARNL